MTPRRKGKKRCRPPGAERGVYERDRGSGVWWIRYVDESRRLHREKVGSKSLALKVYRKRKTEVAERRFFPEQIRFRDITLSAVIDDFLVRNKNRLRTYRDFERYGRYWKEALGNRGLRQIVPGDIERYVSARLATHKPASVNREIAFIKRVFNVAIADGKALTNPVRAVKLLKENNARIRYLTEEEETKLREKVGEGDWPLVEIAMHTGLRQGEQFNLKWETVDFGTGIITMPRSKHGEARHVPMNDTVRELLRTRPSRLKSAFVFPSGTDASAVDACNFMRRVFMPAVKAAGIVNFRWHDLRHTFASRLVMAGVDLRTVQELLGHKTMAMTLRYSHLSSAHQLEAVQKLNRATKQAENRATDTTSGTGGLSGQQGDGAPSEPAAQTAEKRGQLKSWRADSNRGL